MNVWINRLVLVFMLAIGGFSSAYAAGKMNLNAATMTQLESVKGIGPKLAGAIVDYRKAHHGFKSLDELKQVKGIGVKKYAKIKGEFSLNSAKK